MEPWRAVARAAPGVGVGYGICAASGRPACADHARVARFQSGVCLLSEFSCGQTAVGADAILRVDALSDGAFPR